MIKDGDPERTNLGVISLALGAIASMSAIIFYMFIFALTNDCAILDISSPSIAWGEGCQDRAILYAIPSVILWIILMSLLAGRVDDKWGESIAVAIYLPLLALVYVSYEWLAQWVPKAFAIGLIILLSGLALFTKTGRFLVIVFLLLIIIVSLL